MATRLGRRRLARDLTRNLLIELLTEHLAGSQADPAVSARHTITTPGPHQLVLKRVGDLAADEKMPVRLKIDGLSGLLNAELEELDASNLFTAERDNTFMAGLMAILTTPDADVIHRRMVDDVFTRIMKLVEPTTAVAPVPDHDKHVETSRRELTVILAKLRDNEFTAEAATTMIAVEVGWLLATLQVAKKEVLRTDIEALDADIWTILAPYQTVTT